MLTAEQKLHFETFGFLLIRQYFLPDEMDAFSRVFDELLSEDRQEQPFPGVKWQAVFRFIEKRPLLSRLAEDDGIFEPITPLLGPGFVWIGSGATSTSMIPAAAARGCQSTHTSAGGPHRGTLRRFSARGAVLSLESQPGDVVFFNQHLWHAAFGGRTGRRMFTLNFGAKPTTDEPIAHLQRVCQGNLQNIERMQYTQTGRFYEESFLNSDRPPIRGMVAKLVELGFKYGLEKGRIMRSGNVGAERSGSAVDYQWLPTGRNETVIETPEKAGTQASPVHGLAIDRNEDWLFLTGRWRGEARSEQALLRSSDQGKHWDEIVSGLPLLDYHEGYHYYHLFLLVTTGV